MVINGMEGIVNLLVDYLSKNPKVRGKLLFILSSLTFILGATLLYLHYFSSSDSTLILFEDLFSIFLIIIISLLLITIISYFPPETLKFGEIELELQEIKEERKEIKEKISSKPQVDIFDTIQLNLNQLTEYYTLNKSQARSSFRVSIFAIIVGLFTIVGGIWMFYFRGLPNLQLATISSISGIIIEAIGGLYFFLYKRTLDQLNYFYDKLTEIQNIMLAIKLSESIENEEKQTDVRVKIINSLIPETQE